MKETTLYLIGGFTSGVITGAITCYFALKEKFKKQEESKIADIEDYYRHNAQYLRISEQEESKKVDRNERPDISSEEKKNYREELKKQKEYIQYDKMYKGDKEEDSEVDKTHEHYEKNNNRPPRIISLEKASELPGYYDNQTLIYYPECDVLVEEESDTIIDEPGYLIGDCLTKYDFKNSDEDMIYVVNYSIACVYEIQKMEGIYEPVERYVDYQ